MLDAIDAGAALVFFASALGVIPTAALMGRATEELAARSGPGIGGLLNVTFGNAPELIIAFFALHEGLQEVVKASLVGSILGNVLLVMGASMLVGGLKRERQYFDRTAAGSQSLMLLLACVALIMPAIFELVIGGSLPNPLDKSDRFPSDLEVMSVGVSLVLLFSYAAGLFFSLQDAPRRCSTRRRTRRRAGTSPGASGAASSRSRWPASPSASCRRSSSGRSRRPRRGSGCRRSSCR